MRLKLSFGGDSFAIAGFNVLRRIGEVGLGAIMEITSRLLSETESAELAGVTVDTIRQYREFGLLQAITQGDLQFYRESEIRTLFYTRTEGKTSNKTSDSGVSVPTSVIFPGSVSPSKVEDLKSPDTENLIPDPVTPQADDTQLLGTSSELLSSSNSSSLESPIISKSPAEASSVSNIAQETQAPASSERKEGASSGLVELIEINKSLREQVQILKDERDWLRQRVEKMEAKGDREQMLLMSENETVRQLIRQRENRKGFWNFALPWLGWNNADPQNRR